MLQLLEHSLHSRSGIVRKGAAMLLLAPKHVARRRSRPADYVAAPPVLANSFPKSGTHLLDQIVSAFPGCRNYGAFLSSMTSSFRFTPRTPRNTAAFIRQTAPGEIVRAHLFCEEQSAAELNALNFVHYFIMRDPRDVVVSEAHYYRTMNRWHRLHSHFRDAPSLEHAITMAIRGIEGPDLDVYFPDIGKRFAHYEGWVARPDAHTVKYEQLVGDQCAATVRAMIEFFSARHKRSVDVDALAQSALCASLPINRIRFAPAKPAAGAAPSPMSIAACSKKSPPMRSSATATNPALIGSR